MIPGIRRGVKENLRVKPKGARHLWTPHHGHDGDHSQDHYPSGDERVRSGTPVEDAVEERP